MRTLSVDYGSRRVGLSLSDEGGRFATPYDVLSISTPTEAREGVLEVIRREGVQRLVVGLPLNMDDSVGPAARNTIDWARSVAASAGIPLVLVDERLSSFAAEQELMNRKRGGEKMTRGQRKRKLDALAATQFLQEFLDGKLGDLKVSDR